jgi:acyl carrier protein
MTTQDHTIHERLTRIFQRVFDEPGMVLHDTMTAADVARWDSLSHINLITAIEKEFKIRFTTQEIMGLPNVGGMEALIKRKAL